MKCEYCGHDPHCMASWPDPTGWIGSRFAEREVNCTKPSGHIDGIHEARDTGGRVICRWEESQVPRAWQ